MVSLSSLHSGIHAVSGWSVGACASRTQGRPDDSPCSSCAGHDLDCGCGASEGVLNRLASGWVAVSGLDEPDSIPCGMFCISGRPTRLL